MWACVLSLSISETKFLNFQLDKHVLGSVFLAHIILKEKEMKTIYQKYCDGNYLTDEEVLSGIEDFRDGYESLCKLGTEFRITAKECLRIMQRLEEFAHHRKISDKK